MDGRNSLRNKDGVRTGYPAFFCSLELLQKSWIYPQSRMPVFTDALTKNGAPPCPGDDEAYSSWGK